MGVERRARERNKIIPQTAWLLKAKPRFSPREKHVATYGWPLRSRWGCPSFAVAPPQLSSRGAAVRNARLGSEARQSCCWLTGTSAFPRGGEGRNALPFLLGESAQPWTPLLQTPRRGEVFPVPVHAAAERLCSQLCNFGANPPRHPPFPKARNLPNLLPLLPVSSDSASAIHTKHYLSLSQAHSCQHPYLTHCRCNATNPGARLFCANHCRLLPTNQRAVHKMPEKTPRQSGRFMGWSSD